MNKASYLKLKDKDWLKKIKQAYNLLNPCHLCPRRCRVNRLNNKINNKKTNNKINNKKTGFCKVGIKPVISSSQAHFGEERCLVGTNGSGTIFFSSCNLACVFCQNFEISQLRYGRTVSLKRLAEMMLSLQSHGCHNINLVSPTIWAPQIIKALYLAFKKGLILPLVYNTGGYDSVKTLKILDGIIDIYMPDIKYSDNKNSFKYSKAVDYWDVVRKAVKEMYNQVGDLKVNKKGIAIKGLLIRHLVLPNNIAGTEEVMKFLGEKISKNTFINIMAQYYPTFKANNYSDISRRITDKELANAYKQAKKFSLHYFDK